MNPWYPMQLPALLTQVLLATSPGAAPVLPHFFSDGMVLQREREAAIWGQANAGEEVTVSF